MGNPIEFTRSFSPYFTQHIDNDSALLSWCTEASENQEVPFNNNSFDVFSELLTISDEAEFKKQLRLLRHRISCQIIFADINHLVDTRTIVHACSTLANHVLNTALEWAFAKLSERFGEPLHPVTGKPMQMVVFGLGKLGGGELNFSSDVDLVFAYEEDGETNGENRTLSHSEFFTRLAQRLINLAGDLNEYGRPYRIDMRLRPNGNSGPLVLSFAAMEHYFITHGREWERYAWVKASPVAGDKKAGMGLLDTIRPFIYRKYLDYSSIDELAQMKARIEAEAQSKGLKDSIKLGKGGIRSIEFITQSYQLTRGGRLPNLQTPSTYKALERIYQAHLIDQSVYEDLVNAYTFYRRLENHIQMVDDKQQYALPDNPDELAKQARYMDFADVGSFTSKLDGLRERVHTIFETVFNKSDSTQSVDKRVLIVTNHLSETQSRIDALTQLGFNDNEKHIANIDNLINGKLSQSLSTNGFRSLINALNWLINDLSASKIASIDVVLERILTLLKSIGRRPTYFDLIAENAGVRAQLIDIAATSEQLIRELAEYPILLDELISDESDFSRFDRNEWQHQLHSNLVAAMGDIEIQMDILRQQHGAQVFRIAVAEKRGQINRALAADYLVEIAEVIVNETLFIAEHEVDLPDYCTIVPIAYGKLGSMELSYNSDLDLVFVYDSHGQNIDSLHLQRVVRKFTTIITTRTTGGILYTIDDRLRPNGRAGQMVTSIDGFARYLDEHAWTWELQALVRARPIGEDATLNTKIEQIRHQKLCEERDDGALKTDIRDMNLRMKEHNDTSDESGLDLKLVDGGLVDIEFIAQYLVLANAHKFPDLTQPRSTTYILRDCQLLQLISDTQASTLLSALEQILATSQYKKLAGEDNKIEANKWLDTLVSVRNVWDEILGTE